MSTGKSSEVPVNPFDMVDQGTDVLVVSYTTSMGQFIRGGFSRKGCIFSGLLADPGEARGCSTNTLVIDSFINSVSKSAFSSHNFYCAATPKRLEIALPVIKETMS